MKAKGPQLFMDKPYKNIVRKARQKEHIVYKLYIQFKTGKLRGVVTLERKEGEVTIRRHRVGFQGVVNVPFLDLGCVHFMNFTELYTSDLCSRGQYFGKDKRHCFNRSKNMTNLLVQWSSLCL